MGKQKIYLRRIKEVMASTDGKTFRERFKKGNNPELKDFENIHRRLREAVREAKMLAIDTINKEGGGSIRTRATEQNLKRQQDLSGLLVPTR